MSFAWRGLWNTAKCGTVVPQRAESDWSLLDHILAPILAPYLFACAHRIRDGCPQTQKHTSGLTDRGVHEEDFNFEDFWRHQLHRIKEIAEDEQSPKEGGDRNFMESKISSKLLPSFVVLEIRTGFTG